MLSSSRWFGVILGLLVAFGVWSRFHDIEKKSMWADELFSLAIAKYHPLLPEHGQPLYRRTDVHHIADDDTFLTAKAAEQSPPLNDLLEKASVNLLGATELAARLPAALAGCVLLLWFAVFAWRHPDPCVRRVLRWSVLLLTVHPALVQYAQEGRSYSVGVSLVGMAGLLWMLRWREGWRNWTPPSWTEISLMILACYSHYNAAILVILMLFADSVMAMKLRSSQAWWRLIVLGLGFLIWLALNSHTIVFTSNGGVAWFQESAWDHWLRTLEAFPAIVQPLWLSFVASVLIGLVLIRLGQGQPIWHKKGAIRLLALAGMTSMYVLLVNQVTAKAGMSHPRYYIFILPFVIVMLGLVLAELTRAWLIVGAVLVLTVSAQPSAHILNTTNTDDFRSMSIASAKGSDKNTVFLYQLISNRDIYRVYLERFLGHDPRQQLIGISSLDEVPAICKQLEGRPHIAVLGHIYGKAEIDAVYANCGAQWPNRLKSQFQHTYSEHWTVK